MSVQKQSPNPRMCRNNLLDRSHSRELFTATCIHMPVTTFWVRYESREPYYLNFRGAKTRGCPPWKGTRLTSFGHRCCSTLPFDRPMPASAALRYACGVNIPAHAPFRSGRWIVARSFDERARAHLVSFKRVKNRMTSSGFSREDAEEFGFSSGVVATLGVSALPGVGPITLRQLGEPDQVLSLFASEDVDSFESALNAKGAKFSANAAGISGWQDLRERVWRAGMAVTAELMDHQVRCITPSSALYPARLNDLGSRRPNWLFLRGNAALLGAQSVAVVGTRDPSETGVFLTRYAVSVCREFGLPVVSGLAKGIDSTAHEWSVKLRLPTISVLASGLLVPYPARNIGLAEKIVEEGGLLISEYLPRQQPAAEMFVWRNRLQACIAETVIATEWKRSSGTAHTVRFANELRRTSISISIFGGHDAPDAGRGAHHFVLPSQHLEFVSSIAAAKVGIEESDQKSGPEVDKSNAPKDPMTVEPTASRPSAAAQASLF